MLPSSINAAFIWFCIVSRAGEARPMKSSAVMSYCLSRVRFWDVFE